MTPEFAIELSNELLWTAIILAAPVLGLSMLVGLMVSMLQVVTQIQEMSLTFIPKMFAAAMALIAFGPWMLGLLIEFARGLITNIPLYF
jgi:flagellar biosynthesis protein FliQ